MIRPHISRIWPQQLVGCDIEGHVGIPQWARRKSGGRLGGAQSTAGARYPRTAHAGRRVADRDMRCAAIDARTTTVFPLTSCFNHQCRRAGRWHRRKLKVIRFQTALFRQQIGSAYTRRLLTRGITYCGSYFRFPDATGARPRSDDLVNAGPALA